MKKVVAYATTFLQLFFEISVSDIVLRIKQFVDINKRHRLRQKFSGPILSFPLSDCRFNHIHSAHIKDNVKHCDFLSIGEPRKAKGDIFLSAEYGNFNDSKAALSGQMEEMFVSFYKVYVNATHSQNTRKVEDAKKILGEKVTVVTIADAPTGAEYVIKK